MARGCPSLIPAMLVALCATVNVMIKPLLFMLANDAQAAAAVFTGETKKMGLTARIKVPLGLFWLEISY